MTQPNKLRVVIANPGEPAREAELGPDLRDLQDAVGGYVEMVRYERLDLWCNEEGILRDLPPNRYVNGTVICGPIVVAASDEDGNTLGLSQDSCDHAVRLLNGLVTAEVTPVCHIAGNMFATVRFAE